MRWPSLSGIRTVAVDCNDRPSAFLHPNLVAAGSYGGEKRHLGLIMSADGRQNGNNPLCQQEIGQNKKKIRGCLGVGIARDRAFRRISGGNRLQSMSGCVQQGSASGPQTRPNDASSASVDGVPNRSAGKGATPLCHSLSRCRGGRASHNITANHARVLRGPVISMDQRLMTTRGGFAIIPNSLPTKLPPLPRCRR